MKNFLKQQQESISLTLYVLIIFLIVYFVIMPLIGKINSVNDQFQEESLNQEILVKQIEDLPKIQKQFEELNEGTDLSLILLDNANVIFLIEKLEKIAEQTNNTILITIEEVAAIDPKKNSAKLKAGEEAPLTKDLPSQNYLKLRMNISGKYESIIRFVGTLENFEYYSDIIGIQISKNNKESKLQSKSLGSGISNLFMAGKAENEIANENKDNILNASISAAFYLRNK